MKGSYIALATALLVGRAAVGAPVDRELDARDQAVEAASAVGNALAVMPTPNAHLVFVDKSGKLEELEAGSGGQDFGQDHAASPLKPLLGLKDPSAAPSPSPSPSQDDGNPSAAEPVTLTISADPAPIPSSNASGDGAGSHSNPSPTTEATTAPSNTASDPANGSPSDGAAKTGQDFSAGIAYSPFREDNGCRTASEIATDINALSAFDLIRLYGTECNQIANVLSAIASSGNTKAKVFAGVYDIDNAQDETKQLIDQVGGRWGGIHTVSVGNEAVQMGRASVSDVVSAVNAARKQLRAAGYSGPVVTVDTMAAMHANIALCQASDYCAFNCHPFFDSDATPSQAGPFVRDWADRISKLSGKSSVVTESGWPTAGSTNGRAVPGRAEQAAAMRSLRQSFPRNLVIYSAFNGLWLPNNPSTFNAEQHWGLFGNAPSAP